MISESELSDLIARAKSTATLNHTKGYSFMIEAYTWSDWYDLVNNNQTWGKIYNEMKQRVENERQRIKISHKPVSRKTKDKKDAEPLSIARQRALEMAQAKKENTEEGKGQAETISGGIDPARAYPGETKEKAKVTRPARSGTPVPTQESAPKGSTFPSPDVADVKIYNSLAEVKADEEEADEEEADDNRVCLANQIKKYAPAYLPSATHSGTKSKICGDEVSKLLEGKSLGDVFSICDDYLKIDLRTRWLHLNVGQQRMCAGNILRAAIKRGDVIL